MNQADAQKYIFHLPSTAHDLFTYPLLLEEPVLFPELLLETTEMALAMASTADRRSAKVFLSDLSASEKQFDDSELQLNEKRKQLHHIFCSRFTS